MRGFRKKLRAGVKMPWKFVKCRMNCLGASAQRVCVQWSLTFHRKKSNPRKESENPMQVSLVGDRVMLFYCIMALSLLQYIYIYLLCYCRGNWASAERSSSPFFFFFFERLDTKSCCFLSDFQSTETLHCNWRMFTSQFGHKHTLANNKIGLEMEDARAAF